MYFCAIPLDTMPSASNHYLVESIDEAENNRESNEALYQVDVLVFEETVKPYSE